MPNWGKMSDGVWHAGNLFVRKSDGWHSATPSVHEVDGNWHAGSSPLGVTTSAPGVSKVTGTSGAITTGALTATAANGTSPYTYHWTVDSGDALTIDSPNAASTTFHVTAAPTPTQSWNTVVRCTATDNVGNTAYALAFVFIEYLKVF